MQQQQQLHRLAAATSAAVKEHGLPAAVLVPAALEGVTGAAGKNELLRAVPIQLAAIEGALPGSYLLQPGALGRVTVTLPMASTRTSTTGLAVQPQQQQHWLQGHYAEDMQAQTQHVEQQEQLSGGGEGFDNASAEHEQVEEQDAPIPPAADAPAIGSIAGALVQMGRLLPQQQIQVIPRQQQQQPVQLSEMREAGDLSRAMCKVAPVAAPSAGPCLAEPQEQEALQLQVTVVAAASMGQQQQRQQQGTWQKPQSLEQHQKQMEEVGDDDMQLDQQQADSPWPLSEQPPSVGPKKDPDIDRCTIDQPNLLRNATALGDEALFTVRKEPMAKSTQVDGPEAAWADSLIGPTPDTHLFRKQMPRLNGRVSGDAGVGKGPEERGREGQGDPGEQQGPDGVVQLYKHSPAAAVSKGATDGTPMEGLQREQQQQQQVAKQGLLGSAAAGLHADAAGGVCAGVGAGAYSGTTHPALAGSLVTGAADSGTVPCVQLHHLSLLEDPSSAQLLAQSLGLADDVQVAAVNAAKFLR
jgi:hypothetical protein